MSGWLRGKHSVAPYATAFDAESRSLVPELYLDGAWTSALGGARREIRCPADGTLVAEVDEAAAEDTEAAIEAAHRAFHDGPWSATSSRERGDLLLAPRRPARARHRRDRPAGVAGHRQASGREPVRRGRRRLGLPALRPGGGRGRRPAGRHRQPRRRQPDRARTGRRLRLDHAVELPAPPGLLEGRALPRRRQHLRPQAQRAHPAHRDPPDAPASRRPGCRPASATWSSERARPPVLRCPRIPGSTWSPSPAASRPDAA